MKVFNIRNSKKFFERLTNCIGEVEMVNEDGLHLTVLKGKTPPDMFPMTYMDGKIRQMELIFERTEDCCEMLSYLINERNLSC